MFRLSSRVPPKKRRDEGLPQEASKRLPTPFTDPIFQVDCIM